MKVNEQHAASLLEMTVLIVLTMLIFMSSSLSLGKGIIDADLKSETFLLVEAIEMLTLSSVARRSEEVLFIEKHGFDHKEITHRFAEGIDASLRSPDNRSLVFYKNGSVTPGTVRLKSALSGKTMEVVVSLRGRVSIRDVQT